jgi:hypothetical protein
VVGAERAGDRVVTVPARGVHRTVTVRWGFNLAMSVATPVVA